MALENRILLDNLTWQIRKLSETTERGFQIMNKQIQANTRFTLQIRLALDLLLAKEQGGCWVFKIG